MHRSVFMSLCLTLALSLIPSEGTAQTTTGTIDGIIRGRDGNVLPGVMVVANSPALIQKDLTVYSDTTGYYRLTFLPPGTYEVAFSLQGFQPQRRARLVVRVGQTTSVDAVLELTPISETMVVVGEAPLIDMRAAKLAFTYTGDLAENIPTARNVNDLFATVPGVESANNYGVFQPGTIEVQNVLGAGERANTYSLDGANNTDPAGQWNTQSFMPYDTVEEVQVVKSAKPAEIPFQGGLFNIITRSGGNELSGQLGAYFSNEALQGTNGTEIREAAGVESTNELVSGYEVSASLGGRILRDKLWWYASARHQDITSRIFGFPSDVDNRITSLSGKLTYQPVQNHRITATLTGWDQDVSYYFFGFSPSLAMDENAAAVRPVYGKTFGVRWLGVLSDNLLVEGAVAYTGQGFDQLMQPGANEVAIVDLVTGQRRRNLGDGSRDQDNKNLNVAGSLSWLIPDAAGRHDIKAGAEYLPTETRIVFDDFQDHRLHTLFGRKFAVRFLSTPSPATWDNDLTSAYVQDAWSIGDRLTLNIGLRFMHTVAGTPTQNVGGGTFAGTSVADRFPELNATTLAATELINWSDVEPRFALTYAVDRAARTILRAGASRYHHNLESFGLFVSNPAFPHNFVTLWFDRNDDGAFQVGEDGPLLFSFGGQLNPVDPDIERPYSNEFVLGISHELNSNTQVSANFIYRKDRNLTNTVDLGVPFDSYTPVETLDPGPDGIPGTGDDATLTVFAQDPVTIGQSELVLTNPEGDERTYKGLEVTASRRLADNWQAVASLVVSEMEVIKPTTANQIPNLFDNPNGLINAKGLDPVNQTVQLKLQGTYLFDFGLAVSGYYHLLTGNPYTRELVVTGLPQGPFNVFAEPRGSSKTDTSSVMDLRFEQRIEVGVAEDVRIGLILDVFNLFNASTVIDYGRVTGVDYGEPRSIRNPRTARLGVRFTW